jgi:hypothetical protein
VWTCEQTIIDPFRRLDALFRNTAEYLQAWGQRKTSNVKLQTAIANTVIFRFDTAQDHRVLSLGESWLRRTLKHAVLGLASLERTIARQRSRIRWLQDGDANTKLFHAIANGRKNKNFIPSIRVGDEIITDQDRKVEVFTEAYTELLGKIQNRDHGINLDALNIQVADLQDLEHVFTEEEIWQAVKEMTADRAPWPDGFIGAFYQTAWPVIKGDIMRGLLKLGVGDGRGFACLNRATITLIPKKIGDYRPIGLAHSFSKLFSKVLANCLRRRLGDIISPNQSAFVKGRCLHDNFILARQVARRINQRRCPGVLLKLDLSRAFDSISWSFLFEALHHMGFGEIFLKWLSLLLYTANTKVTVNGMPSARIQHARGLRQGDPTSPMLFVAGMEVLTVLMVKGAEYQIFKSLAGIKPLQRISIFADDVVLFIRPEENELLVTQEILRIFGGASGLKVNYSKTTAMLIRGSEELEERVKECLGCNIAKFLIKYLGLPLALRPLTRSEWQPWLDGVTHFLPPWQRGMIARSSHLILIKSVISARQYIRF